MNNALILFNGVHDFGNGYSVLYKKGEPTAVRRGDTVWSRAGKEVTTESGVYGRRAGEVIITVAYSLQQREELAIPGDKVYKGQIGHSKDAELVDLLDIPFVPRKIFEQGSWSED